VPLEANKLYSFVTRAPARILDPNEQPVRAVPAAAWGDLDSTFSLQTLSAGRYYVEFDHGASLVCSDMWANDLNAQYHAWAFYTDDHSNTSDLATVLSPGVATDGAWELDTLQNVFDEDWFRVEVTDTTTLTLRFQGSGAGNIDSFNVNAPNQAVGYLELFPPVAETTDLAELFPEPGTYLVRILQSFGDGKYALELN
jgi:hypothetical protein